MYPSVCTPKAVHKAWVWEVTHFIPFCSCIQARVAPYTTQQKAHKDASHLVQFHGNSGSKVAFAADHLCYYCVILCEAQSWLCTIVGAMLHLQKRCHGLSVEFNVPKCERSTAQYQQRRIDVTLCPLRHRHRSLHRCPGCFESLCAFALDLQ